MASLPPTPYAITRTRTPTPLHPPPPTPTFTTLLLLYDYFTTTLRLDPLRLDHPPPPQISLELIRAAMQLLIDRSHHPLLLLSSSGTHQALQYSSIVV